MNITLTIKFNRTGLREGLLSVLKAEAAAD
jgi:hypothetical protein